MVGLEILVVIVFNTLISATCLLVVAKLMFCHSWIVGINRMLDQAVTLSEQLHFAPLSLSRQQLQLLQLRQIYHQQSSRVSQLRQLLDLFIWLNLTSSLSKKGVADLK